MVWQQGSRLLWKLGKRITFFPIQRIIPCLQGGVSLLVRDLQGESISKRAFNLYRLKTFCFFYLKSHLSLIEIGCPEGYFKNFESLSRICGRNCHDSLGKFDMDEEVSMFFICCPPWSPHHAARQALTYFTLRRGKASSDFLSDCEFLPHFGPPHSKLSKQS